MAAESVPPAFKARLGRSPAVRKASFLTVVWVLAYLWVLTSGLASCGGRAAPLVASGAAERPAAVLAGRAVPRDTVEIGSLVSGLVTEVSCDEGQVVHAGQRCARLDVRPFEAALQREEAVLRSARAREAKDRSAAAYADAVLARTRGLLPGGVVSEEAVEAAQDASAQARAQLDIDRAEIARARASLRVARLEVARTDIVVPIDGVVAERRVNVGQAVVATLQAPTLFLVASSAGRQDVEVAMDCGAASIPSIGAPATVAIDPLARAPLQGHVRRVGGVRGDLGTPVCVVSIEVNDPQRRLAPGMRARVAFDPGARSR